MTQETAGALVRADQIDLTSTSVEYLTKSAITISRTDIKTFTNNWIVNQGSPEQQLQGIRGLFAAIGDASDVSNEIVLEAWNVLTAGELWKVEYATKAEAIAAIDTPLLRDLRNNATKGRRRKGKYIETITKNWADTTPAWVIDTLGENCLYSLASISKRYSVKEAMDAVVQITMIRLREVKTGRGSTRQIQTTDWQDLEKSERDIVLELTTRPPPSDSELAALGTDILTLTCPKRGLPVLEAETESEPTPRKRIRYTTRQYTRSFDESSSGTDAEHGSDSDASNDGVGNTRLPVTPKAKHNFCACRGVSTAVLDRVSRKSEVSAGMMNDAECVATLRIFLGLTADDKKGSLNNVCYKHLSHLGGHIGMQIKKLTAAGLRARLVQCWEHRADLTAFKMAPETSLWWRLNSRPPLEDDSLGIYAFHPRKITLLAPLTMPIRQLIVAEIAGPGAWGTWGDTGNIIAGGIFKWLWDGETFGGVHEPGIGNLMDEEFDMYLHHQRERNGQPNKGWLRTMFYSLTQQIIRQDLTYWAIYACLRPDRNVRLVSYPYYTKYAQSGDATYFRHIDMNIPKYLQDGHGGSIIQGSISLDDETVNGCTELQLGFHKHIAEWWGKVQARGHETNGEIHGLDKIWTREDTAAYGDFVPCPCQRGDARITRPEIPHGSTGDRGGGIRRTVLPWFVGVREDGETLDNVESDKWSALVRAHAGQTGDIITPSGLANRYAPIPYKFPPSTQLWLASPVSRALVCRTSWDDPVVQGQANVLLGSDRASARAVIKQHRIDALRAFKATYMSMRHAEKLIFGPASFYLSKGG
ncbi:hypothetical protein MMC19_006250 [Ptychographa xylographoides]|nr:hypothetical protein [Ptychographa xylographoides]